jgi:hypothetical protein
MQKLACLCRRNIESILRILRILLLSFFLCLLTLLIRDKMCSRGVSPSRGSRTGTWTGYGYVLYSCMVLYFIRLALSQLGWELGCCSCVGVVRLRDVIGPAALHPPQNSELNYLCHGLTVLINGGRNGVTQSRTLICQLKIGNLHTYIQGVPRLGIFTYPHANLNLNRRLFLF